MDARTPKGPKVPDRALVQKTAPVSLGNSASSEPKSASSEAGLKWQQINPPYPAWRLVNPDGPQLRLAAVHGMWGGYEYPKALAYVFDVGMKHVDWRVRVRLPGNKWRAFGCVIDLPTAKRIAQEAVENPAGPKPSKFTTPSNLLCRRPGEPALDGPTWKYIRDVEIGGVLVESPNTRWTVGPDNPSINLCATDDEVDLQRLRDLADETMDEAWIDWPPAPDDLTDTGGAL
jgi:hypothetical protein